MSPVALCLIRYYKWFAITDVINYSSNEEYSQMTHKSQNISFNYLVYNEKHKQKNKTKKRQGEKA